jgi:hypothetical protein
MAAPFKWFQNPNTITITFNIEQYGKKTVDNIEVLVSNNSIQAGIKGSTPLICQGTLSAPVKSSKWELKGNVVVIQMEKVNKGRWNSLFAVTPSTTSKVMVKVLFDYDAADPLELSIRENDIIHVLSEDASGWWKGECNGVVGLFPHNFVEKIEAPETPSQPEEAEADAPQEDDSQVCLFGSFSTKKMITIT